jgi:hypothetical protein
MGSPIALLLGFLFFLYASIAFCIAARAGLHTR